MVVRLPIYSEPLAVQSVSFMIFAISATNNYVFTLRDSSFAHGLWEAVPVFATDAAGFMIYSQIGMNCSDASVTDGDDYYTSANRMYVNVNAPIQTEQIYLFVVDVQYVADQRFKVYVSPNDVASDSLLNTHFVRYVPTAPDAVTFTDDRQNIDLGASYDFRAGMGGNVWAQDFYLAAGDTVTLYTYSKNAPGTNGYHTIMIPFRSATSTVQFSMKAWAGNAGLGSYSIDTPSATYYNYILQAGWAPYNATVSAGGDYYIVELTSTIAQRVTFLFEDLPNMDFSFTSLGWYRWGYNATENTVISHVGSSEWVRAHLYSDYLVCNSNISTPVPGPIPEVRVIADNTFDVVEDWGSFLFDIFFDGFTFTVGNWEISSPGLIYYYIPITAPVAVGQFLWNSVLTNIFPGLGTVDVFGWIVNAIDAVWDFFAGIGEWLWSIGEMIYDALVWLANAIMEYGSILLSILVLAVVMIITFFAIWGQLKIWSMGVSLAKGDVKGAVKTGQEVADVAGKVGGKVL
jgi:hypothetical protein